MDEPNNRNTGSSISSTNTNGVNAHTMYNHLDLQESVRNG